MSCLRLVTIIVILSGVLATSARADLSVPTRVLSTGVGPVGDGIGGFFDVVENPFSATHYFEYGPSAGSTAFTTYDFAWSNSGGDFRIDASHQAEDSSNGFLSSISNGDIIFTSSQPLLITVDAEYTYDLPTGSLAAALVVAVGEVGTHEEFMAHSFLETFPGAGTFEVHDQTILPAGREYLFSYRMNIHAFESTGVIGRGDGFAHFTLQTIPEPSTLGLVILAAAISLRRRAR